MQINHNFAVKITSLSSLAFVVACVMLVGCVPSDGGSNGAQQRNLGGSNTSTNAQTTGTETEQGSNEFINNLGSSDSTNTNTPSVYRSPFDARAVIEREVSFGDALIIEEFQVPSLEIQYDKADFVQVMRCAASYKMQSLTGEDIRHLAGRPGQQSALEWAWAQAFNDNRQCKMVGVRIIAEEFQDLTAPKGEYYYVTNPCVLAENSVLKKDGCSYNLMLTYPVTITDSFSDDLREKNEELAIAESSLNANLVNAKNLAKKIEIHLRACENKVANDIALLDFKKGLVQFGFLAVGAAIGSFAGPNGAVMLGQMAGTLGAQYFNTSVLRLPNGISNECIDSSVVATTEEQRKEASEVDDRFNPFRSIFGPQVGAANDASVQGKYEEEFQVQALTKRFQDLLAYPDGPIARDTERVSQILNELYILDTRVVQINAESAAASLGFDINDPSTYPTQ